MPYLLLHVYCRMSCRYPKLSLPLKTSLPPTPITNTTPPHHRPRPKPHFFFHSTINVDITRMITTVTSFLASNTAVQPVTNRPFVVSECTDANCPRFSRGRAGVLRFVIAIAIAIAVVVGEVLLSRMTEELESRLRRSLCYMRCVARQSGSWRGLCAVGGLGCS